MKTTKGKKSVSKKVSEATQPESPFAKYRGIGNPAMRSGRKALLRYTRELRGR